MRLTEITRPGRRAAVRERFRSQSVGGMWMDSQFRRLMGWRGERCLPGETASRSVPVLGLFGQQRESQRDSATKPRVARNELPWDCVLIEDNPERVAARGHGQRNEATTPLAV